VEKSGVVYIIMVTRDGCPSCQEQKPPFERLSNRIKKKHTDQTEFLRVHVSYSQERKDEAKQSLDAFQAFGFPTYIVAIRDSEGNARETYRSLDASISEIERNIEMGLTVLSLIRKRSKTCAKLAK
jgi:thiol-disulfide isomerase/thioredoxin